MSTQNAPKAKSTPATSAVFLCLYQAEDAMTKQEVAERCALSLPTVYQAFSVLEEQGLICAGDNRLSTGGRRAQTFAVSSQSVAAIGISLTGHSVRGVACDLYGNPVEGLYLKQPLQAKRTKESLVASVAAAVATLETQMGRQGLRAVGVGIAVPSAVDPASGRLLNTSVLRLSGKELFASELCEGLGLAAQVFNDANCGAYSQIFPRTQGESLAYLSLERGVGGGVVIDGRPVEGPRGTCGEFGHLCIVPGGKKCACGREGCLEAYCSSNVLSEERGCTLDEFFSAAGAGDADALAVLDDYIGHLARGIQAIHTMLGVDVALGGEMASYLEPWFDRIVEAERAVDPFPTDQPCILRAKHPNHGVPLGAAQLMARRFIESV